MERKKKQAAGIQCSRLMLKKLTPECGSVGWGREVVRGMRMSGRGAEKRRHPQEVVVMKESSRI